MASAGNESFDHPTISDSGRAILRWLNEHPNAPKFTGHTGSRLRADDLEYVQTRTDEVLKAGPVTREHPTWLDEFIDRSRASVPHYRTYDFETGAPITVLPTIRRRDLSRDIARFVPDHVEIGRLISYATSGTTGHPLQVPSHPRVAGNYLAYHRRGLHHFDLDLASVKGSVGVVLLGHQKSCFTYTSVVPLQNEVGLVKLNLHRNAWRSERDCVAYLEALDPEILSGDPISFVELLRLAPACRPRAIFSTAMTLLPGLRDELTAAFRCPVLDFYSMNEAGPIGVFDSRVGGHVLLQPELYVELLDPNGTPVEDGERGEITLTGGFNFCLPLLRYRTGDFASFNVHGDAVLMGLAGREPVRFQSKRGIWVNNVDVLHALRPLALAQFSLHQRSDGSLTLSCQGDASVAMRAKDTLSALMDGHAIELVVLADSAGKIKQFTTDFPGGIC
jgi:phenylacetate-CoA ligase